MKLPRKVYLIRHNATNRVYIGSSSNADQRIAHHISDLRRGAHPVEDMQADFDEHGENYTFTILDEITEWKDRLKEYEWMKKFKSDVRGIGYNYKDKAVTFNESAEGQLLDLINESADKERAILEAIHIITSFLLYGDGHTFT